MFVLIYKNIKEIIKNKKRVVAIAISPMVLFGILLSIYSGETIEKNFIGTVEIGVIDKDNSIYSNMLIQHYESNEIFTDFITIIKGNEEIIEEKFLTQQIDATIIIPENFGEDLIHMTNDPVLVNISAKEPIKAIILENVIKSYEQYIMAVEVNASTLYQTLRQVGLTQNEISVYNAGISYELIMTALERNNYFEYIEIIDIPNTNSFNYFFIGIITLAIMYFGLYVGIDLLREREQKTFQRLKVTGINAFTFVFSKFIGHVTYLFGNAIIWIMALNLVSDLDLGFKIVVYIIIGIIFSVSFSIFLSSLLRTQESVLLLGNVFYFVSAVMGGSIIPLQYMPQSIQQFSLLTPNYWFIRGFLFLQSNIDSMLGRYIGLSFTAISFLFIISSSYLYKRLGEKYV